MAMVPLKTHKKVIRVRGSGIPPIAVRKDGPRSSSRSDIHTPILGANNRSPRFMMRPGITPHRLDEHIMSTLLGENTRLEHVAGSSQLGRVAIVMESSEISLHVLPAAVIVNRTGRIHRLGEEIQRA